MDTNKEQFQRTEWLIGKPQVEKLANSRVAVFGLGGVGGYVVEALARAGVGTLDLVDRDIFSESNLNRQILATHKTIGRPKTDVAKERVAEINPDIRVNLYHTFFLPDNTADFPFEEFDYVVDAIDTVSGKIALVECARKAGVPVICAMGAGNKLDAGAFEVTDIEKTSVCPLARVMRKELKERGIRKVKVVYSKESPRQSGVFENGKAVPGSISYVPSVMGLLLAGEVIRDLTGV
ncbi:MAG: tRNA threonylcarbamoyladenosine dehydratase [Lachnospiraceae bacterium]|nr:tRNA threonylcarbamoyladenosine dehydratase [Lachnospiraceae bacterium]